VDVTAVLHAHGGSLRAGSLRELVGRRQLARAVAAGEVIRDARGAYSLPGQPARLAIASALRGVQSHLSAAEHWGFALTRAPAEVHITIPQNAQRTRVADRVRLHYRDLDGSDVVESVTCQELTVIQCLRDLPLADALGVGDSALAMGVRPSRLERRANALRGPGSARVRTRLTWLDARAANAFESACRAILLDGGIEGFEPQLSIHRGRTPIARVDLGHRRLRILIECESFAHHGSRDALRRDCRRYTTLAAMGWLVLRFSWEDVMFHEAWVLAAVRRAVATAQRAEIAVEPGSSPASHGDVDAA
jgi:very-short-patch-repair endonuclease